MIPTRYTGCLIPSSLLYSEDSSPIFSVITKVEPVRERESSGRDLLLYCTCWETSLVVPLLDFGRRFSVHYSIFSHKRSRSAEIYDDRTGCRTNSGGRIWSSLIDSMRILELEILDTLQYL